MSETPDFKTLYTEYRFRSVFPMSHENYLDLSALAVDDLTRMLCGLPRNELDH